MEPKENWTHEYQALLAIPGRALITLNANNPQDVQGPISSLLSHKARFEAQPKSDTILVFSDEHFGGKEPIGCIVDYEIPGSLNRLRYPEMKQAVQRAA